MKNSVSENASEIALVTARESDRKIRTEVTKIKIATEIESVIGIGIATTAKNLETGTTRTTKRSIDMTNLGTDSLSDSNE